MKYQKNYAADRPQMYDKKSRVEKANRIVKTLTQHLDTKNLSELVLLDIGGSSGIIANELSKYFKKVVVADIDVEAINYAKTKFKRKNLIFTISDAMKLKFKENTFDVIICTHVYEHVPNPKKLFSEIRRVLKPGGICYLAAQNKLWPLEAHHNLFFLSYLPKELADIYIKIFRNKEEYYEHPMTYWELKSTLSKFKVHDYTAKILKSPEKFGYKNLASTKPKKIVSYITAPLAKYTAPTLFWILEK